MNNYNNNLYNFLKTRADKLIKSNLDDNEKKLYLKYFDHIYNQNNNKSLIYNDDEKISLLKNNYNPSDGYNYNYSYSKSSSQILNPDNTISYREKKYINNNGKISKDTKSYIKYNNGTIKKINH